LRCSCPTALASGASDAQQWREFSDETVDEALVSCDATERLGARAVMLELG
jgi:hypothetical protein